MLSEDYRYLHPVLRIRMSVATPSRLPQGQIYLDLYSYLSSKQRVKCKVHPCTGTEALYRPYGP
jgi:hypothetical protein